MRVEQLGDGTPDLAVVAGIHGDEPCGVRAVERILDERPTVERPVKLVVANEEALEKGVRYVDADMNRSFPGDPDAAESERRLAAELAAELDGCLTLSLHSTQSSADPFAVVDELDARSRAVISRLPVEAVVETGTSVEGRLFLAAETVEVECGLQGSNEAAENGYRLVRSFLAATGALPSSGEPAGTVPVFRLADPVPKRPANEYQVFAANFEPVASGEPFAAADDDRLVAEEDFYPVLMSPYGYETVFGYTAEYLGELDGTPADD